jgi:hypothetical protein
MKACKEAEKSNKFTRIVQRRDLPWEKDSIARAAYDPEHIPDCNVQAMVGKHFLFHEVIPKAESKQSVIDVHFCQFARLSNAIKADKLPPAVELQARRLVHGNASSGKKSWKSIFLACAGASTYLVHSGLG